MLTSPGEQLCLRFSLRLPAFPFPQLLARHYTTASSYGTFSTHHQILTLPRSSQNGEEMFGLVFAGFTLPDWWYLLTQQIPKIKVNFTISLCPCRTQFLHSLSVTWVFPSVSIFILFLIHLKALKATHQLFKKRYCICSMNEL